MKATELTFPSIHLNGTSREALSEQYLTAGQALQNALRALEDASPNARDYYPQGEDAFRKAVSEHNRRTEYVREALAQVQRLFEYCESP